MSAVAELPQPIAGAIPSYLKETTIMTIWPSIAAMGLGQTLGWLFQIKAGVSVFTVGNLFVFLSIPLVLALIMDSSIFNFFAGYYACGDPLSSGFLHRSRQGATVCSDESSRDDRQRLHLEADAVRRSRPVRLVAVVIRPGQEWYPAGDLIFRKGKIETFQLKGVRRPETFRQTVMKARDAYVGVKKAME